MTDKIAKKKSDKLFLLAAAVLSLLLCLLLDAAFNSKAHAQNPTVPGTGLYGYVPWSLNGGSNSFNGNSTTSGFTNNAGITNTTIVQNVSEYEWVGAWAGFSFITNGAPPYNISATNLITFYFANSGDGAQFETTNTAPYRMTGIGNGTNFVWCHTNFFVPSEGSLQLVAISGAGTNTGITVSNLQGYFSFKAARKTVRPN